MLVAAFVVVFGSIALLAGLVAWFYRMGKGAEREFESDGSGIGPDADEN
ncbi:MAG: hypothetical protein U1E29_16830 [Coriobacteriia bacterium]|jgi:predicted nuclease with RNAse H fold|nr:hypothetical protein [Coriobacteriia bacterium]